MEFCFQIDTIQILIDISALFPGTIEVFELSDEEVDKLMTLQKQEEAPEQKKLKKDDYGAQNTRIDDEEDITLLPSILAPEEVETYIDLDRMENIFTFSDHHNEQINDILRIHVTNKMDPTRFIVFDDKSLSKMLIQVMWEDETVSLEMALITVAELVSNHARKQAEMMIDQGISHFVEDVLTKTEKGTFKKAREIVQSSLDSRSRSESLGSFLDRVLASAGGEKSLVGRQVSSDLIRKYLTIHPVMTKMFAKLKESIILGIPQKRQNSTKKKDEL